jgi:hypothetical protein
LVGQLILSYRYCILIFEALAFPVVAHFLSMLLLSLLPFFNGFFHLLAGLSPSLSLHLLALQLTDLMY